MLEVLDDCEALQSTIDLKDRLERAKDPTEVIAAIADAISEIGSYSHELDLQKLHIQASDRLADIHTHVTALYKATVIPRHYEAWWQQAQKELTEDEERYSHAFEELHSMPCTTIRDLTKVREILHEARIGMDPNRRNDPPAEQKLYMERFLEQLIEDRRTIRIRLMANAPTAASN